MQATHPQKADRVRSTAIPAGVWGRQQQTQTGQLHILVGRDIVTMLVPPTYMSSSEMRKTEVASATGEVVGTIDQVMIDTDHGHIAYVLLLQEGFLGIDDQWIPVPYEALQWSTADQGFALSIAEDQLQPIAKLPRQNLPTDVRAAKLQQFYAEEDATI